MPHISPITESQVNAIDPEITWENVARSNRDTRPTWRAEVNGIDVWIAHTKGKYRVSVAYGDGNDEIWDCVSATLSHFSWIEARKQEGRGDKEALNALNFPTLSRSLAIDCAQEIVTLIQSLGLKRTRSRRGDPPAKTGLDGWWLAKAEQIVHALETRNPDAATRDSLFIDSWAGNSAQIVGRSAACRAAGLWWGDTGTWREHVIPVNRVLSEARRLAATGAGAHRIAHFLKANLTVVILTAAEAERLDSMPGLQNDMPQGWSWGDDPFARLAAAEIAL